MEHLFFHLIKLLFNLFKENNEHSNAMNFRNIHYDVQTKVSVLNEQINAYFKLTSPDIQLEKETYIKSIIDDLKKDFTYYPEKNEILDNVLFELNYGQDKKKNIVSLLKKL